MKLDPYINVARPCRLSACEVFVTDDGDTDLYLATTSASRTRNSRGETTPENLSLRNRGGAPRRLLVNHQAPAITNEIKDAVRSSLTRSPDVVIVEIGGR